MHGRTEFTGKRRMCGGYGMCQNIPKVPLNISLTPFDTNESWTVNNDDYISRLRLLSYGREEVLNSLGSQNHPDAGKGPYSII